MFAQFNQCFEVLPDAVILVDRRGIIVQANTQAGSMFGYENDGLIGMDVNELVPPDARDRHNQHLARYLARPHPRPMSSLDQALIGRRRDGSEFEAEIALAPMQTDSGSCVLASIRDVSDSRRARQALLRARYDRLLAKIGEQVLLASDEDAVVARLPREIAEALPADAVAIVSTITDGGAIVLRGDCGLDGLSPSALQEALGDGGQLARAQLAGSPLIVDDLQADDRFATSLLGEVGFRSALYVALGGRERPIGALIALSRQPGSFDQDSGYCLGTVANLLSGMILRRRTEEQLAHSQRLDAIGRLTGGIAHDFNNLLTVVSGNLQLIEISLPELGSIEEMLRPAQRAVDSAAQLTGKLLTFARRQHLSPQWIDTSRMLSEMVALLRRTLGETVLVEINAANELPSLHADRAQLESALLNLALNARDAMPRGGELRIEARVTEVADAEAARLDIQPGRFLSLIMVDTGFGMSPETLEHAFEPFFTTKSPSEGNGLGLSMVYGFVRQSGGQVCVESQLGYGTRFELMLPLQERPAEAPSDAAPATPADGVPGGSEWILVVEDDPAVRRVTLAFLRSLGYRVDEVPSAELAIDFVAQAAGLALVLSDVVLGNGRSGVELAQELATLRPGLPVLLTSGYEHQTLQQLGIMTGQFELLRKPYRREQLALMLRRKLDSASV